MLLSGEDPDLMTDSSDDDELFGSDCVDCSEKAPLVVS